MEREKRSCGERFYINEPGGSPCSAVLPVLRLPIFNFLDINNKSEPISDWIKVRIILIWWTRRDSNPRPLGCEPNALPAELWAQRSCFLPKQLLYFSTTRDGCKAFLRVFPLLILKQLDVQPLAPVQANHKNNAPHTELGRHGQPHA